MESWQPNADMLAQLMQQPNMGLALDALPGGEPRQQQQSSGVAGTAAANSVHPNASAVLGVGPRSPASHDGSASLHKRPRKRWDTSLDTKLMELARQHSCHIFAHGTMATKYDAVALSFKELYGVDVMSRACKDRFDKLMGVGRDKMADMKNGVGVLVALTDAERIAILCCEEADQAAERTGHDKSAFDAMAAAGEALAATEGDELLAATSPLASDHRAHTHTPEAAASMPRDAGHQQRTGKRKRMSMLAHPHHQDASNSSVADLLANHHHSSQPSHTHSCEYARSADTLVQLLTEHMQMQREFYARQMEIWEREEARTERELRLHEDDVRARAEELAARRQERVEQSTVWMRMLDMMGGTLGQQGS